jgi:hypothetical protein
MRFKTGFERDMIGYGEYQARMTFDSAGAAKVDYNFLTAQDLRPHRVCANHG